MCTVGIPALQEIVGLIGVVALVAIPYGVLHVLVVRLLLARGVLARGILFRRVVLERVWLLVIAVGRRCELAASRLGAPACAG